MKGIGEFTLLIARGTQMRKALKTMFLFFTFSLAVSSAIAQDWNLSVTVPVAPNDRFGVCDTAETSVFTLTNVSGVALTNDTIRVVLPTGMFYEPGSIVDISSSGIVEYNTASAEFIITSVPSTAPSNVVTFSLDLRADCSAIPLATGSADNNFDIHISYDGGTATLPQPRFTQTSPNFEVAKPTINIPPVNPNPLQVTLNLIDTIDVLVNNGGQASLDSFYYFVVHHADLTLLNILVD